MKLFHWVVAVSLLGLFVLPGVSVAQNPTVAELQAEVQSLLAELQSLQQQLAIAQGRSSVAGCHVFNANLEVGNTGPDVTALQQALSKDGETVSVTGTFDDQTASAVTGFQHKYANQVLAPSGLTNGTGYVGRATRAKLNSLFGCNNPTLPPTTTTTPPVVVNPITPTTTPPIACPAWGCGQVPVVPVSTPTSTTDPLSLLVPIGGEIFTQGASNTISWSNGLCYPNAPTQCVDLGLYDYTGQHFLGWIADGLPSTGSYSWDAKTICSSIGGGISSGCTTVTPNFYRVWAADAQNGSSMSKAQFSIIPAPAAQSPTINSFVVAPSSAYPHSYLISWSISDTTAVSLNVNCPQGIICTPGLAVTNPQTNQSFPVGTAQNTQPIQGSLYLQFANSTSQNLGAVVSLTPLNGTAQSQQIAVPAVATTLGVSLDSGVPSPHPIPTTATGMLLNSFDVTASGGTGVYLTQISITVSNDVTAGSLPLSNLKLYVGQPGNPSSWKYFGQTESSSSAPQGVYTFNGTFIIPQNGTIDIEVFADVTGATPGTYTAPITLSNVYGYVNETGSGVVVQTPGIFGQTITVSGN